MALRLDLNEGDLLAEQKMPLPPLLLDGAEYHADPIRRALSALAGDRPGRVAPADLTATLGSDYTLTVTPGRASVPAPADGTGGVYLVESAGPVTLAVTPPHATRDRIDRLVARVMPGQAGTPGAWYLTVREGEPAASPVPPAAGAALVLYDLWVHSAASGRPIELADLRLSHGQQLLAGVTLAGAERPATAPAGTVWTSTTTGQSWATTGQSWRLLGPDDATLASHALSGSRAWGPGINESQVDNLVFAPGRNGGLIELASGGTLYLSRPGRWALTVQAHSDEGTAGSSKIYLDWPSGAWLTRDLADTRLRGSGFAGAGILHQSVSWTGVVTNDQSLNPITVRGAFTPSSGFVRPTYQVWLYADYLGR
ncbi:hypothetical protein [Crossiella sp. NPDC003009]